MKLHFCPGLIVVVCFVVGVIPSRGAGGTVGRVRGVCLREGGAAITEVWIEGKDGARRLGTFPGGPGRLFRSGEGDRILYREQPLALPLPGIGEVARRVRELVPAGIWEIETRSGKVRFLGEGAPEVGADVAVPVADSLVQTGESEAVEAVAGAVNMVSAAYNGLYGWDFSLAAYQFEKAGRVFERLPETVPGAGFFNGPLERYGEALKVLARRAQKEGPRWTCREQLGLIGDLLQAYRHGHDGQWPAGLDPLVAWVAGREGVGGDVAPLKRMLRLSGDWKPGEVCYSYQPGVSPGQAAVTAFIEPNPLVELLWDGKGFQVRERTVDRAQVDSLLKEGGRLLDAGSDGTVSFFQMLAGGRPRFGPGICKLGYAYFNAGKLKRARSTFERAITLNDRNAEAYNGLGLVYWWLPKGRYDAIRYFQKALQYDPKYVEARYHIAQIRYQLKEYDVKQDAEKLIAMDPKFAPAYKLLGEWYETWDENYDRAAFYYLRYLSLWPKDPEGLHRLAAVYLKSRHYDRILGLLETYVHEHPEDAEVLPLLAQACMRPGMYDRAEKYFRMYLAQLPPEKRTLYEDIRLVSSAKEYQAFQQAPDRAAFLKRFWAARDPDLTTAANERRLEHYRRVWYALQNFSEGRKPWDMRGEVYVRFGEPDYRSRSDMVNFKQSLAVQRVKERLALAIYGTSVPPQVFLQATKRNRNGEYPLQGGDQGAQGAFYPGPVYPVRSLRAKLGEAPEFSAGLGISSNAARALPPTNFRPVSGAEDASMVPWEDWVYPDVDGGIEIVFTDEYHRGDYEYAPSPADARIPTRQLRALVRYNPKTVAQLAASAVPNYYVPAPNEDPLEFSYDRAEFRASGEKGNTALEVYLGIPRYTAHYLSKGDETRMEVEGTVALLNEETGTVYRKQGEITFQSRGDSTREQGAFVPDAMRLSVPPGRYRMEVKAADRLSSRHGRYRQEVVVKSYGRDSLEVSGLEVAWRIGEKQEGGRFNKGDLQVIPMPTRTYGVGQSIYVYYEIYNLRKDAFGQTKYEVSYTVQPQSTPSLANTLGRLTRLRASNQEAVVITYQQEGTEETEVQHTALKLEHPVPGRYVLTVKVKDRNSGQVAVREAGFTVSR